MLPSRQNKEELLSEIINRTYDMKNGENENTCALGKSEFILKDLVITE